MDSTRIRVLCIDDEARILRALKALLRDYDVFSTTEPESAAQVAATHDVDVVICDQRMPQMIGVEALRLIRERHPRAMRILLTGYSDLNAVLGSVNEGEVFRFVNKPWDNQELRAIVAQAGQLARETPAISNAAISERDKQEIRKHAGVLVIEDDPETQTRLREILGPHYQLRFAATTDRALQVLEQHETGVVISETDSGQGDLTGLIKTLKQYHPHIASVVLTDRANAQLAIDLINEGQVFRMLLKPVRMGSCRLSVEAALGRYWQLKNNPKAAGRFAVVARATPSVPPSLLQRIKALPQRLFTFGRIG